MPRWSRVRATMPRPSSEFSRPAASRRKGFSLECFSGPAARGRSSKPGRLQVAGSVEPAAPARRPAPPMPAAPGAGGVAAAGLARSARGGARRAGPRPAVRRQSERKLAERLVSLTLGERTALARVAPRGDHCRAARESGAELHRGAARQPAVHRAGRPAAPRLEREPGVRSCPPAPPGVGTAARGGGRRRAARRRPGGDRPRGPAVSAAGRVARRGGFRGGPCGAAGGRTHPCGRAPPRWGTGQGRSAT